MGSFEGFAAALTAQRSSSARSVTIVFEAPRPRNTVAMTKQGRLRDSVFAPAAAESETKKGSLLKQSSLGAWQARYFVAAGHYLKYYNSLAVADQPDFWYVRPFQ